MPQKGTPQIHTSSESSKIKKPQPPPPLLPPCFGPNRWEASRKPWGSFRKPCREKGGEIETRVVPPSPPFSRSFRKLPQGFRKLPQGFRKLPEALRKTYGLLKLRGSGREGQGTGKEGARGTSMSVVVGVIFQGLSCRQSVGNPLGAKYFDSVITLQ